MKVNRAGNNNRSVCKGICVYGRPGAVHIGILLNYENLKTETGLTSGRENGILKIRSDDHVHDP